MLKNAIHKSPPIVEISAIGTFILAGDRWSSVFVNKGVFVFCKDLYEKKKSFSFSIDIFPTILYNIGENKNKKGGRFYESSYHCNR